jgi:hypothetical protein
MWGDVSAIGDALQSLRQNLPASGWVQRMETVVTGAATSVDLEAINATTTKGHTEAGHMFGGIFASVMSLKQTSSFHSTSVFDLGQQQSPMFPLPPPTIAPSGPRTDALLAQVNALAERLHQLETYTDAMGVEFAQVGMMSLGDMKTWAKMNFPSGRFGMIPGISSLISSARQGTLMLTNPK